MPGRSASASVATRALLFTLAWAFVGTVSFGRHYLAATPGARQAALLPAYTEWLTCYLPWGFLSLAVFAAERRFPLRRSEWPRHLLVLAALGLPTAYAACVLTDALGGLVAWTWDRPASAAHVGWRVSLPDLVGHGLLYASAVAGSSLLRVLGAARESERRAARLLLEKAQLETSLREAELEALRMRLQPHFLFNSLQNISVLVKHDPETGSRMLTRLGDLLRAALGRDGEAETTLATEVALTRAYLAVEEMRFGDRLSSRVEIAPGTEQALVPTFLLQPLVENALRHGLGEVRRDGVLVVRSAAAEGRLLLSVSDNGAGVRGPVPEHTFGIGLGATRDRLRRMYPHGHALEIRGRPEGGTEVRLTLPLRYGAITERTDGGHPAAADRG
jgi:signal transduction histidine kinase